MAVQAKAGPAARRVLWLAAIVLVGATALTVFALMQRGETPPMNPGNAEGTATPAGGSQPRIAAGDALKVFEAARGSQYEEQSGDQLQVTFTCDAFEIAYCHLGTPEQPGPPLPGSGIPATLGQRFLESFPKNRSVYRCSKPAAAAEPIRCEVAAPGSAAWEPVAVDG